MSKRAPRLPLEHEYHDGAVVRIEIGPRREVVLHVRLDPVWNDGDESVRRLQFSAIENFDEVAAFFARHLPPPPPNAMVDEVVAVMQPAKRVVGVELSHLGYIELHGAKVRES
jgi:hypothetical protein